MGCGGASKVSVGFACTSQNVFCVCLVVPEGNKIKTGYKIQHMDKFAVAGMDYLMIDIRYLK